MNFLVIFFICAPPNYDCKQDFWEAFIAYIQTISSPYVILCDFNELNSYLDKVGRAKFRFSRLFFMNMLYSSIMNYPIRILAILGKKEKWPKQYYGKTR